MAKIQPPVVPRALKDLNEARNISLCGEYDHTCKSMWGFDNVGGLDEHKTCHMFHFLSRTF